MADDAAVTLPELTKGTNNGLTGGLGWNVLDPVNGYVYATPPLPSLEGGGTGITGMVSSLSLTLPMMACQASGDTGLRLPSLTVAASGLTGDTAAAFVTLPQLNADAIGLSGRSGGAALWFPLFHVDARGIDDAELLLPALRATASGLSGAVGLAGAAALPALEVGATGITVILGAATLRVPLFRVEADGLASSVGRLSATLPALALAAAGASGSVGVSTVALPVLRPAAGGYVNVVGVAALELPTLFLRSAGFGARPVISGSDFDTLALNTLNEALTRYTGWTFNSMAQLDGLYLAAGPDGIFKLEGDTDDGVLIDAAARLGVTDFGDPNIKKVDQAYFGYRSEGDLKLVIITDEHDVHEYRLVATGHEGAHNARAKLGKGMRGRYFQVGFENEDGGDFRIDQGELRAVALKRRLA